MSDQNINDSTVSPKPDVRTSKGKTVLLVILSILFVISSLITLISYDIWRVVFNPPLIKELLTEELLESDLAPRVLEDISVRRAQERVEKGEALSGVDEPDIELLLSFVDFGSWKNIRELIIVDDFIRHLISVSVDGIYAWIDSPDELPAFVWEMDPLKERLIGNRGEEAVMIAYALLPECTDEEIDDFLSRLAAMPPGVEVLYNLCQFPDPWREDQVDDYIHALLDVNENIPPEYDFNLLLGNNLSGSQLPAMVKTALRTFNFLGRWGWIIPLVLAGLIAAIGVRSLKTAGKWLGIPLLIIGVLVLVFAFLTQGVILPAIAQRLGSEFSPLLRTELAASFKRLYKHFYQPMLIEGAIISGIGVILIVLMVVLKKKPKSPPTEV